MMIRELNVAPHLRLQQTFATKLAPTQTDAEASPDVIPQPNESSGIAVSQLKQLGSGPMIQADQTSLDRWASEYLTLQNPATTPALSDDAPQNRFADVKVNGKTVATIYNGESAMLTNEAAATIGFLKEPAGLVGPDLATWRADAYASALGGTVEMAATAKTQADWTARMDTNANYTRAQLDKGLSAYFAENQSATSQRRASFVASFSATNLTI